LVSFINRQADKQNPNRGGSRNRYLFRTIDGKTPSYKGNFRLYKHPDQQYDGMDKTGKTSPMKNALDEKYCYLYDWYQWKYLYSE
jgi:hypothetical protein